MLELLSLLRLQFAQPFATPPPTGPKPTAMLWAADEFKVTSAPFDVPRTSMPEGRTLVEVRISSLADAPPTVATDGRDARANEPAGVAPSVDTNAVRQMAPIEVLDGGFLDAPGQRMQVSANDPEVITTVAGGRRIAISTLAPDGVTNAYAHLDQAVRGPFRIFAHHQNRTGATLQQVVVLHNPGTADATVNVEAFASTTTGQAPYIDLGAPRSPAQAVRSDPGGAFVSGPGDATADAVLRGRSEVARVHLIPAGATRILHVAALPNRQEITTQAELTSDQPLHVAVAYANAAPRERDVLSWIRSGDLLAKSSLDHVPTAPGARSDRFIYGRVAGIVPRSTFFGRMTNDELRRAFVVEQPQTQRFVFNAKTTQRLGTERDDAAEISKRYPTSAFRNHANYGAEIRVAVPLVNNSDTPHRVRLYVDSPPQPGRLSRAMRQTFEVATSVGEATRKDWMHASISPDETTTAPLADIVVASHSTATITLRSFYSANNTTPQILRLVSE